jgi:segregation and condensation protein B
MEIGNIIPHIEALIFASEKPLTAMELTELANNAFGFMDEKLTLEQIQTAIDGIVEKYRSEFYPFEVRESGGGLQFLTKKEYHKTVAQLNGEKFLKKLSTAALETLSIIAYKQPVTKGEIEAIRGVSSDYAIQRLLEKELIVITGRNEKMPGHPLVYATSRTFMDYFGINSPEDLPKLKEVFEETMVSPTLMDGINHPQDTDLSNLRSGESELLAVTQNGELTTAKINPDAKESFNASGDYPDKEHTADAEESEAEDLDLPSTPVDASDIAYNQHGEASASEENNDVILSDDLNPHSEEQGVIDKGSVEDEESSEDVAYDAEEDDESEDADPVEDEASEDVTYDTKEEEDSDEADKVDEASEDVTYDAEEDKNNEDDEKVDADASEDVTYDDSDEDVDHNKEDKAEPDNPDDVTYNEDDDDSNDDSANADEEDSSEESEESDKKDK